MAEGEGEAGFARALRDPGRPPPAELGQRQARRFAVHRNAVVHGLTDALAASFPAVERLVGAAFFAAMAREYLAADPPRSPLLFRYGAGFPGFVAGFAPAARIPYLADVARIDWLWLQAYHAADAEPLAVGALAGISEDALGELRLGLHPSLGLVSSRWPAATIWAETTGRIEPGEVDMRRAEHVAVLRPRLSVEVAALPAPLHALIAALAQGSSLAAAAGRVAEAHPEADLAPLINGLFAIGAVAAIKRDDTQLPSGGTRE